MKTESKSYLYLLLAIIFLILPTHFYIVVGELGRQSSLFISFLLFSLVYYKYGIINKFFLIFTYILFMFVYIIGYIYDQAVLDFTNIIFGFISFTLFYFGTSLRPNVFYPINFNYIKIILPLVSLFSVYSLFKFIEIQSEVSSIFGETRGFGDLYNINAVGIAYVYGLLFLVFYSLIIYFNEFFYKIFSIIGLISTIIVIFLTSSRGILIYILITIVITLDYKKINIKSFVIAIVFILPIFYGITFYLNTFEVFNVKINDSYERIISLFEFFKRSDNQNDLSAGERVDSFNFFYNNVDLFIPFGMFKYVPYPHNQFLELIMRFGFFGLIASFISIFMFFYFIFYFRRNFKNIDFFSFLIFSLFIVSYLQSLSSLSLEMNRFLWFGFGYLLINFKYRA